MRTLWPWTIGALVLVALPAHAEPKDKCNGADGIAPELVADCNQSAYDQCRPSYRPQCIDKVLRDYRYRTKELGKQGERAQAAEGEKVCDSDGFVQECTRANTLAKEVCNHQGSIAGQPVEVLAEWRKVMARAPEAKAFWAGFAPKYPQCVLSRFKCSFSEFDTRACAEVEDRFRGAWRAYRDDLAQKMDIARASIAQLTRNPFDWGAAATFDDMAPRIAQGREFATIGYLQVDVGELDGWAKWLADEKAKWQVNREKALEKVQCPTATNKDKALTGKLRKVMDAHHAASRKPDSTLVETVGSFGLTGAAVQSHQALPPVTFEDQGGFACVRQDQQGKVTCRILKVTFRRSKPAGSGWSDWEFYSVGGGDEMSCRNLK